VAVTVALIFASLASWAHEKMVKLPPSLAFVKPGVVLNPDSPNAFWVLIVTVRGSKPLYNADLVMDDRDRREAFIKDPRRVDLLREATVQVHYPELDNDPIDGKDAERASLNWKPLVMENENLEFLIKHREGAVREALAIRKVDDTWAYKMTVTDEKTKLTLIDCMDNRYPASVSGLKPCFPNYRPFDKP
jgi:hypothetical protein